MESTDRPTYICPEKQTSLRRNWVFTLESYINWVVTVFNWVFVKFISGNTTFLLYFLCNFNCFNWVGFFGLLFDTLCLKKRLGKYPETQLICFSVCLYIAVSICVNKNLSVLDQTIKSYKSTDICCRI